MKMSWMGEGQAVLHFEAENETDKDVLRALSRIAGLIQPKAVRQQPAAVEPDWWEAAAAHIEAHGDRICAECRHYNKRGDCIHPQAPRDHVTGDPDPARWVRVPKFGKTDGVCGRVGRLFEPRQDSAGA